MRISRTVGFPGPERLGRCSGDVRSKGPLFGVLLSAVLNACTASAPGGPSATPTPTPSGVFVYADTHAGLMAYAADDRTGGLQMVSGSPFASGVAGRAGSGRGGQTLSTSGRFLYHAAPGDTASSFMIDPATGALTALGPAVPLGRNPCAIAVHPSGRFVHAFYAGVPPPSDGSAPGILPGRVLYHRDLASGTLSAPSAQREGFGCLIAPDPSGKAIYSVRLGDGTYALGGDRIDLATGELQPLDDVIDEAVHDFYDVESLAVDPTGRFLYAAVSEGVVIYQIGPDSHVTEIGWSGPRGQRCTGVAVDPLGRYVYVAASTDVWGFSMDRQSGALAPVPGAHATTNGVATLIVTDPSGQFIYVGTSQGIWVFAIDVATGALQPVSGSPFGQGQSSLVLADTRER